MIVFSKDAVTLMELSRLLQRSSARVELAVGALMLLFHNLAVEQGLLTTIQTMILSNRMPMAVIVNSWLCWPSL